MESKDSIDKRATRIREALQAAFGVRARTLSSALRKTGRRMPRRLHAEAQHIVAAQRLGGHPKLMKQVNTVTLAEAERAVVTWLAAIDRADRRKGMWLGIAAMVAFNVLLVGAAFVLWLWWTGQI